MPLFVGILTDDKTRKLFEIYNANVNRKPVFSFPGKNKAGYEFVNQLNILLQPMVDEEYGVISAS